MDGQYDIETIDVFSRKHRRIQAERRDQRATQFIQSFPDSSVGDVSKPKINILRDHGGALKCGGRQAHNHERNLVAGQFPQECQFFSGEDEFVVHAATPFATARRAVNPNSSGSGTQHPGHIPDAGGKSCPCGSATRGCV